MTMNPHGIKFTDEDWQTITTLANELDMSAGEFVNEACKQFVEKLGATWQGGAKWGDSTRWKWLAERNEVARLGLPPLVDDDEG